MFSSSVCQPQILEAVLHLVSSVRAGCSGIILPRGRQHRAASTQCRHEELDAKQKQQLSQLDLEQCMTIILHPDNLYKLSAIVGTPSRNHWSDRYVSAPTFFENKTGFTEQMLVNNCPNMSGLTLFLKPEIRHLLSRTSSPGYTQTRGFKQVRKTSPAIVSMLHPSLDKYLTNERPAVQEKIIGAYTEGCKKGASDSPADKTWLQWLKQNTVKMVVFSLGLYWAIQIFIGRNRRIDPAPGSLSLHGMNRMEVKPEQVNVSFADVRGCDEVKQELNDIVQFLREPEKFQRMGAKLPKGILMVGSPGVGKTLLAKAVAGEAGVPFFHMSGSEFDEIYVGSGAKKVRQLFYVAKSRAPSVVFIDEIDSVGAKRTNSQLHPYANQTINQLLSEMDGFAGTSGVIVIGATNKKENLDHALLRPGRFDVEVHVMQPDVNGRKEIFKLYLSKVKADKNINLRHLASLTYGMTGADICNIVNQAALYATLKNDEMVTMEHLDYARDKVTMGPAWKNRKISNKDKLNTAYHEAGHALVAYHTKFARKLRKVTIVSRGGALGHTAFLPEEDMYGPTKAQLLAEVDVANGGRIGEEVIYGRDHVTTGASSDFQMATRIATLMVKKYGMSEKVGTRVFIKMPSDTSPKSQQLLDAEINRILAESYQRALKILQTHAKEHVDLAMALMKYETLSAQDVDTILNRKPVITKDSRKEPKVISSPGDRNLPL